MHVQIPYDSLQFWLIPLVIVVLGVLKLMLRILLFPIRLLFWLALLSLPVWAYWNWGWLSGFLFGHSG